MKIIKTSNKLPPLRKGNKQKINKKELLKLAEQVKGILRKEEKLRVENDENLSSSRNAYSY